FLIMADDTCNSHGDELSDRLQAFSLSDWEAKVVDIAQDDIKLSDDECRRSLFGKVIGDRPASWIGIRRAMSQIWKLNQPMEVKDLSPNYFQFIFQDVEDKKRVSAGNNWSFENQYLILREWSNGISSKHQSFRELTLWVQIHNIPLNWVSSEVGFKIGRAFKSLKNVVVASIGNHGGKLLRLLVTLDIDEPIPRVLHIRLGDQIANVMFKYEKLLNLCHYCGKIGHLDRNCARKMEDVANSSMKDRQYGDWLKAADGQRWSAGNFSDTRSSPPRESPSMAENTTAAQDISSSIPSSSNQIAQSHNVTISLAKSVVATSLISATQSLHKKADIIENNLQIVESIGMEVEKVTSIVASAPLQELQMAPYIPPLKTWKRVGSSKGRLQRASKPITHNDNLWKGNRAREDSITEEPSTDALPITQLGFDNRLALVDPVGLSGGLVLCWDSNVIIHNIKCRDFYIVVLFQINSDAPQWGVFVYCNPCRVIRGNQWEELIIDKQSWGHIWFSLGDWNDIISASEKEGGLSRNENSFLGFRNFINAMEMSEIKFEGYPFTWCNNRAAPNLVEEKMDRAFCSFDWSQLFPIVTVHNVIRSSSDHSVLLLDMGLKRQRRKSSFHFDKRWLHKEGFSEVVTRAWQIPVEGTPFFQIKEKIKNTRIALLIWSSTFQSQHQQQMAELTNKLETLNEVKTGDKWEEWINTRRELNKAHFQEELYWQQKAKHKWLREGDANTHFFHAYTLQRRKLNAITRLVSSQGTVFSSQKEIETHISDFYRSLFSTEGSWGGDTLLPLITP
ncbi:Unknown protein, partial [Striga hermonthica]